MTKRPNILLIINDDMGYSDLGCYGGEARTPNLNALAENGLRYTQFYNTARCCPSRASMLTGLYPQQADVGHMVGDDQIDGYLGDLNRDTVTIAEALGTSGYRSYMCGKWHVTGHIGADGPKHNWPANRGFDDFYGIITGAANYWNPQTLTRNNERIAPEPGHFFTDRISEEAVRQISEHCTDHAGTPFFQYVAYTAPHWPLHAHPEDIAEYAGAFDAGWDTLREERLARMVKMGIIDRQWLLTARDPRVAAWDEADHKEWQAGRMEVYAAQLDRMDRGIGTILQSLKDNGQWDNTLIVFLADNGACAEELGPKMGQGVREGSVPYATAQTSDGREVRFGNDPAVMPGPEDTYQSCGTAWANVSNTPFRLYKHWVHEGGISTPFIAHWPAGIAARNELRDQPAQLPDIMATFLDIADTAYPASHNGRTIKPLEGFSIVPTFADSAPTREVLYWEHEGNKAVRRGIWKLVCRYGQDWELYNMAADRSETRDLAVTHPRIVSELTALHDAWAERCGVMPWEALQEHRRWQEQH